MANTVITNYTDLNGPSSKSDSSVVVIVNKDGSLSVDQKLLGTLMGSDGSQAAGISVVRVGHEGKPDDATDSENEDEKIPHVTLSVDSYCDEPNSIIKYDSGAEMLQSLRIETRENSLVGFHNDHCYTSLKSPSQVEPQQNEAFTAYDDPVIEITQTPPQRSVQHNKKITILEQQIIPKGKKIIINPTEASVILKGNDILNKPLSVLSKPKHREIEKKIDLEKNHEESADSSSISSSSESAPDRDSDSDYKDAKDRSVSLKLKRSKVKPRILKNSYTMKESRLDIKTTPKSKLNRSIVKRDIREKIKKNVESDKRDTTIPNKESLSMAIPVTSTPSSDQIKIGSKQVQKVHKKEKKTPAHVTALLSDMTSLFSTPDVIRRVSTDNKTLLKQEKETVATNKKANTFAKSCETNETKSIDNNKFIENTEKLKGSVHKTYIKQNKSDISSDKPVKSFDTIPQLDDASLAQILQEPTPTPMKIQPSVSSNTNVINSPGLAGPLSPTLDLLAGLQPEEEGLTEDLLMHVAQLVESSENLQEVIDKQVLGKVDTLSKAQPPVPTLLQQPQILNNALQTPSKLIKNLLPRKDPIEIVRRDGRVITLPPIEAPATRASKRKSQVESSNSVTGTPVLASAPLSPIISTHEPALQHVSKQYVNKKLTAKKQEPLPIQTPIIEKTSAESQESWNSEDDPNRLWCICKQPHNNRFMICCDSCEDWFHGKCVNITKAMGQQMEEEGIEWRCPNCVKSTKTQNKNLNKVASATKNIENQNIKTLASPVLAKDQGSKTNCIVCKKSACASSIYCSDACILRHAQDSLGSQGILKSDEKGNVSEKLKSESRVIVYERKTGRLLAGPNAPTAENLKSWLQKNPTFEVVRPGTLSTIKPNLSRKKSLTEANKIQTTLNFEKISKKSQELKQRLSMPEYKDKAAKSLLSLKEEIKTVAQPKTPVTPKSQQSQQALDTAKSQTTSSAGKASESRKAARTPSRSTSTVEKAQAPSVLPLTPRRKDVSESRMKLNSTEPIRDNVKKALHEQMSLRMAETSGVKFTEDEILQFAIETEFELHELFRDVGMKYKAKYRSLMFNIKDRKNLSLWQKICDRTITPQQLVRLSPEELASQELAQWRDKEAKHQLELIKKSELDLLAASKTYVLKTHKGEEVMETKESVSTELDPNVPVEDLVTALNDSMGNEQPPEVSKHMLKKTDSGSHKKYNNSKKKDKENGLSGYKSKRESKKDSESKKKSRSSRKRSENRDKELRTRRSEKKLRRSKSQSKEDSARDKTDSIENVKGRSRSRVKSKRHFKETSRSTSRGRERSRSSERSRHRSRSKEYPKHRQRSRSKHDYSTEEKVKHRSKSQENPYSKNKNDSSTDSESIERPKSAMLKETHPEYDPHEPMITSAFSEEDLRKSREDVYEDGYKNDLSEYREVDYDPSKSFSIGTSVVTPTESYITTQDKASEVESDQEPSSTVENSAPIVWNGCINMVDVARFYVAAHEVSGNSVDIEDDLSTELDVVGRINPETVWDYILKMKRAGNKDIVILRLQAANDEEKMQYIALYSYLSSRNRLGVVKVSNTATVKDFYIVPLSANSSLPPVLLPLEGPGLEVKTHLLIAIVIRQRKKRLPTNIPKEIIPTKVVRESRKRSYTPPVGNKSSYTPPASPKRRAPLPLPVAYTSPVLSTTIKDKIAATLASVEDEEAYSPGSSTSSSSAPASSTLRCKMEELNRQIEEQKQQILKMTQADSSIGTEDEAYSPSRPMTPPSVVPLADIALPSNLQEILATIKQRTETAADVDMRTLPPL